MATITGETGIILLYPNLNATHRLRYYNHHNKPQITCQIPTTQFPFAPLKVCHKPPPLHLTFASLNPNFSQKPSFYSKFTPTPHHLETLQYVHDNVTSTVGPLVFASLSSSNPIEPLKAVLAKCMEFLGPLKTTLWAILGAAMSKAYELFSDNPSGLLKTPLWPAVASGLAKWLDIYSGVLLVRILLGWFPNMPWERQPFSAIRNLCDPFLSLFRTIIPPVGNLDVSPLLAFAVLGTLGSILGNPRPGPAY